MKYWFAAKRYGYGWYPVTREGWAALSAFLVLLYLPVAIALQHKDSFAKGAFEAMFIPYAFGLTMILLWICYKKGEPARWRWGGK